MTILVIDKTEENQLRDLFTLFGTPFKGTKYYWLSVPSVLVVGVFIGFAIAPFEDTIAKIIAGIIYGVLVVLSTSIHTVGHIISSRMVGAPVTYIQMSATVNTLHFDDAEALPSSVHIGRSIGGPLLNLIIGLLVLLFYSSSNSHYLAFFAFINVLLFAITILPLPTLDGAVIVRELRK